jgi:hypothetical protein
MNEAADRSREAGMEENVKAVFISNYINHHQIPFSNALYEQLGDDYHFIQTEPMEEERIAMGWGLQRLCHMLFGRIGRKNAAGS